MIRQGKRAGRGIPVPVMDYVVHALQGTYFGEVVLVAQDGSLIQVEHTKKLRVDAWKEAESCQIEWTAQREKTLRERIESEFSALSYGRLAITVQQGKIKQMNRLEMQRFIDGDGI